MRTIPNLLGSQTGGRMFGTGLAITMTGRRQGPEKPGSHPMPMFEHFMVRGPTSGLRQEPIRIAQDGRTTGVQYRDLLALASRSRLGAQAEVVVSGTAARIIHIAEPPPLCA